MVRDKRACKGSRATWARALDWGCPAFSVGGLKVKPDGRHSIPPSAVHRLVNNYSDPSALYEPVPMAEMTVSYAFTDGRCPDYNYCETCLPRVLRCYCISDTYSPPPPLPPLSPGEVLSPPLQTPEFHLYVGKCIPLGDWDGVAACPVRTVYRGALAE